MYEQRLAASKQQQCAALVGQVAGSELATTWYLSDKNTAKHLHLACRIHYS